MKILIGVNSLQQGGAERAALKLAESLIEDKNEVIILTWHDNKDFYSLPNGIRRFTLNPFESNSKFSRILPTFFANKCNLIWKLYKFRRFCQREKIDVFIGFESFLGSVLAIALLASKIPVIVSERISPDPRVHPTHRIANILRPYIYKHGAICSVQTFGFQSLVKEMWGVDAVITPNHLETHLLDNFSQYSRTKTLLSLGRFDAQKDYETLIKAWSRINEKYSDWQLSIFGRGDISNYYFLSEELSIRNIHFGPPIANVREALSTCGIFISSSKYEGFPNVVLESIACGAPTISTQSSDVIADFEKRKSLVAVPTEDIDQLAKAISRLIEDSYMRDELSRNARKLSEEYAWEIVGKSWYSAINAARLNAGLSILSISEK